MWQPLPVKRENGLGMNVARKPCCSASDFTRNLKNVLAICGLQCFAIFPVDLKLTIRVFVVILIRLPILSW